MSEIDNIIRFTKFLHQFQSIERVMWLKGREHPENDAEHSYQLAMVAWYAVNTHNLPLNIDLIIKYALAHDLVEVYAGDVDAFNGDPQRDEKKALKEHEALQRMKIDFAEFPDMLETIEQYELRKDEESKFVYALDKVLPAINAYMDNGRTFHKQNLTLEKVLSNKIPKVAGHTEVKKYFNQLADILKREEDHLFPKQDEKI